VSDTRRVAAALLPAAPADSNSDMIPRFEINATEAPRKFDDILSTSTNLKSYIQILTYDYSTLIQTNVSQLKSFRDQHIESTFQEGFKTYLLFLDVYFCVFIFYLIMFAFAFKSMAHCGSAFDPDASGLPYYFTSFFLSLRAICVDSNPQK